MHNYDAYADDSHDNNGNNSADHIISDGSFSPTSEDEDWENVLAKEEAAVIAASAAPLVTKAPPTSQHLQQPRRNRTSQKQRRRIAYRKERQEQECQRRLAGQGCQRQLPLSRHHLDLSANSSSRQCDVSVASSGGGSRAVRDAYRGVNAAWVVEQEARLMYEAASRALEEKRKEVWETRQRIAVGDSKRSRSPAGQTGWNRGL